MAKTLASELGLDREADLLNEADHCFAAGMAALAALRGLNGAWTLDLHDLPDVDYSGRIRFCGVTHYWWSAASASG